MYIWMYIECFEWPGAWMLNYEYGKCRRCPERRLLSFFSIYTHIHFAKILCWILKCMHVPRARVKLFSTPSRSLSLCVRPTIAHLCIIKMQIKKHFQTNPIIYAQSVLFHCWPRWNACWVSCIFSPSFHFYVVLMQYDCTLWAKVCTPWLRTELPHETSRIAKRCHSQKAFLLSLHPFHARLMSLRYPRPRLSAMSLRKLLFIFFAHFIFTCKMYGKIYYL